MLTCRAGGDVRTNTEDQCAVMITPVLLCGGAGTRLWPLSRKSYPKQFVPLLGDETLFQASVDRLRSFERPLVVTGSDFRFIVTEQLAAIGVDPDAFLIEPESRNTAPAILAAAFYLAERDPEALLLVCPSDHLLPDTERFRKAIDAGVPAARAGQLVTFGVVPTYPATGYGYLELGEGTGAGATPLLGFVEKPDADTAARLMASGRCMWNAGIFLFKASVMIEACRAYAPTLIDPVRRAVDAARPDLGFLRLDPAAWAALDPISIDYAVMERAHNLSAVTYDGAWSDLGGWDTVLRVSDRDGRGVATHGRATAIDCDSTLLRSESDGLALVGIGLDNVIAVAMNDAVLVADATRSQDVKEAVRTLKAQHVSQAEQFPKDHRPWGWVESLATGDGFKVKRIVVYPGAALSLQSHQQRAEHWIVLRGTARAIVGDEAREVSANQSVYIPAGAVHRLENPGTSHTVLIEVQTGAYFGDDDVIRYEEMRAQDRGGAQ